MSVSLSQVLPYLREEEAFTITVASALLELKNNVNFFKDFKVLEYPLGEQAQRDVYSILECELPSMKKQQSLPITTTAPEEEEEV